jgi:3-oxoacyl-[acyl-carrier protein] reductase
VTPVSLPWVVVAGAGGGLGRVIVARFAGAGRTVLALDADEVALGSLPKTDLVIRCCCDLGDPAALDAALEEALPRSVRVDLVVNAGGLIWNEPALAFKGARLTAHGLDSFERVVRANLTTTFVTSTRMAARMARSGGGVIVNFSSIAARGNAGQVAYSAAKAGVEGLTRALAQELGPLGIRVNAIAPGFIDVGSTRSALASDVLEQHAKRTPVRRLGAVGEVADAIESLYRNGFMNGVVLELDGGLRL